MLRRGGLPSLPPNSRVATATLGSTADRPDRRPGPTCGPHEQVPASRSCPRESPEALESIGRSRLSQVLTSDHGTEVSASVTTQTLQDGAGCVKLYYGVVAHTFASCVICIGPVVFLLLVRTVRIAERTS